MSNELFWYVGSRPSLAAIASMRSLSKPLKSPPSGVPISNGGYGASVPTSSCPSLISFAFEMSTVPDSVLAAVLSLPLVSSLSPQPDTIITAKSPTISARSDQTLVFIISRNSLS